MLGGVDLVVPNLCWEEKKHANTADDMMMRITSS